MRIRQETYAGYDDVKQAYCKHMRCTVDGILGKSSRKRPFLKWRSMRILPLLINPWEKIDLSPTHMRLIIWGPMDLLREWLRAVY